MFPKQMQHLEKQETHFNGTIFLSTLRGISIIKKLIELLTLLLCQIHVEISRLAMKNMITK